MYTYIIFIQENQCNYYVDKMFLYMLCVFLPIFSNVDVTYMVAYTFM